jgi:hypothetical protein
MDELVGWLRERLDEDERVALRLEDDRPEHPRQVAYYDYATEDMLSVLGLPRRSVLARVEAERMILDAHSRPWIGAYEGTTCDECMNGWPCPTLRALAYGHRHDGPGYDPAWDPEGAEVAG